MRVRQLRLARGWSQAQLAERSGLSVRTIQRIEKGAHPGLESLNLLAAALDVDPSDIHAAFAEAPGPMTFVDAVTHCLRHFADFDGLAGRPEFWWFTLAVVLAAAVAEAISPGLSTVVGVLALLPWLAAATRRLRAAGESPWWLLILFAPVGGLVVVGVLAAKPTVAPAEGMTPAV